MPENFMDDDMVPVLKNNMLEGTSSKTGFAPDNQHIQFSYTYDTDGYPVTMTQHDITNGTSFTGYYYY